jgi:hypothetical protein
MAILGHDSHERPQRTRYAEQASNEGNLTIWRLPAKARYERYGQQLPPAARNAELILLDRGATFARTDNELLQ